jgi:NitT/TauT family transport system substrate-binding protein
MKKGFPFMLSRLILACAALLMAAPAFAEAIKIATTRSTSNAPLLIAKEKGYFADEGLVAELIFIDSAGPITAAVVTGDVEFGGTGLSAAFYNLAGQGTLRIVAGHIYEAPGWRGTTIIASMHAWEGGLRSFKDLGGHSVAVTQVGTPLHYTVGRLAERYGFDMKSVRIMAMQSFPNAVAAATGGSADVAVASAVYVIKVLQQNEVKLVGYGGDEFTMQVGAIFTATKTANERGDMVRHFLAAFRRATRTYHDIFTGPDGKLAFGPGADDIIAILARYNQQPPDQIRQSLAYVDADARVDVNDVRRQIAWYKSQGMVKGEVDADALLDKRYVIPLPAR